jgi:hypothetical protein
METQKIGRASVFAVSIEIFLPAYCKCGKADRNSPTIASILSPKTASDFPIEEGLISIRTESDLQVPILNLQAPIKRRSILSMIS